MVKRDYDDSFRPDGYPKFQTEKLLRRKKGRNFMKAYLYWSLNQLNIP